MAVVYEGHEPYIFVSYSHKNAHRVKPLIAQMQRRGCRVWYDTGIQGGKEWPAVIAEHIKNCSCFMLFLSPDYVQSHNCRQEIHYALKCQREILPIYLSEAELSEGLDMQLSPIHALHFEHESRSENILRGIFNVPAVCSCQAAETAPPAEDKPAQPEAPKEKEKPFAPILRYACAVLVIPMLLLLLSLLPDGKAPQNPSLSTPGTTTAPTQTTPSTTAQTELPETTQTLPPETTESLEPWQENMLMARTSFNARALIQPHKQYAFGTKAKCDQIVTITFLATLVDAPADAVDASQYQTGKVKAWTVPNEGYYDLYIAAEGGVYAPENCAGLFEWMFCLKSISFNNAFYTEHTTNMSGMFNMCRSLRALDLSGFDTSNVTNMSHMFAESSVQSLDLSSFRTENVTNMSCMFYNCSAAESVDLSGFVFREDVRYEAFMNDGVFVDGEPWENLFAS